MSYDFQQLIQHAQSPDNAIRLQAEQELMARCDASPAEIFATLIQVASNESVELFSRQFCLLSLRKFVTFYWSAGFESYKGPPGVGEETKANVRDLLLNLCLNDNNNTKIKSSASYCVVQISAVDYPDQWPTLLQTIYNSINVHHSAAGLRLLAEIFDDVVTEEMFFAKGVGMETFSIIYNLLQHSNDIAISWDAKIAALELYSACVEQLSSPSAETFQDAIVSQLREMNALFCRLLETVPLDVSSINTFSLRKQIYANLNTSATNRTINKSFTSEIKKFLHATALHDLINASQMKLQGIKSTEAEFESEWLEYIINLMNFIISIQSGFSSIQEINQIVDSFIALGALSDNERELWRSDFNEFVAIESELSGKFTVRDSIYQFFSSLPAKKNYSFTKLIIEKILTGQLNESNEALEAGIYLLGCTDTLDEDETRKPLVPNSIEIELSCVQYFFTLLSNYREVDEFVLCRSLLTAPKFLKMCMEILPEIKKCVQEMMTLSFSFLHECESELVKVSGLMALVYYDSFVTMKTVLETERCLQIENAINFTVADLVDDAEDDTPGVLVESLSVAINMSSFNELKFSEFKHILNLGIKSPDNIQVVLLSKDSLESILGECDTELYLKFVRLCFPDFIKVINASNEEYSSMLVLILELVTAFMKKSPKDGSLPPTVIDFILEPLLHLMGRSQDEGVLQMGSEALSFCIANGDVQTLLPYAALMLSVLEKLFGASEAAALNLGSLVVQIFKKFYGEMHEILPQILEAVVKKLISAKTMQFSENLVGVLCYLANLNTDQFLQFLISMEGTNDQSESVFSQVMNVWLGEFDSIRGENRIRENIVSLLQIYFNQSVDLSNVIVNDKVIPYDGDLIITRSMAKQMPTKYTKVSVYEKIVKALVDELSVQLKNSFKKDHRHIKQALDSNVSEQQQQDNEEYELGQVDEETNDSDGWEDIDDALDYDKLNEYAAYDDDDDFDEDNFQDYDDEDDEDTEDEDDYGYVSELAQRRSVKELLVQFFKEAASQNIHGFSDVYNRLSEDDKKCITDVLL